MDRYLQQIIRNWANQQQPPRNGRARLLLLASSPSHALEEASSNLSADINLKSNDRYSMHRHESARVLDLLWVYHSIPDLRVV
jgi:hypothetical protein